MRPFKPGPTTSEYELTGEAARIGRSLLLLAVVLCAIGLALAAAALTMDRALEGAALCAAVGLMSVGFGASGARLLSDSTSAYSESRGRVKAAALVPDPQPVNITNHNHGAKPPPGPI